MTVLDNIYKFIGKNNLGVTGIDIIWKFELKDYLFKINHIADNSYYAEVKCVSDFTKTIFIKDNKVIHHNCHDNVVKFAKKILSIL